MVGIVLFGGTGSIGTQTLSIIRSHPENFKLVAFTYHHNITLANQIIDEFSPEIVGYTFDSDILKIKKSKFLIKNEETEKIIMTAENTFNGPLLFINALTGASGLRPTYLVLKHHHDCLLANKESLILAGDIIKKVASENKVKIIPIDSEHSGLYRLIKNNQDEIDHLIITASGGALRNIPLENLGSVKARDALKHPNWQMGKEITINCATMVNKAYEVLEAHHLFDCPLSKIEVLIHKESTIHALVEYSDGAIAANLGIPSMEIPIAYAIAEGMKNLNLKTSLIQNNLPKLSLANIKELHFDKTDEKRYPCFTYLLEIFKKGGYFPTIVNAANEVSVNLFLDDQISYCEIYEIIKVAVNNYENYQMVNEPFTIDNIIKLDQEVRAYLSFKKKGRD